MKGLGWYSLILVSIAQLGLTAEVLQGIDVETNIYALGLFTPVVVFAALFLRSLEVKK